MKQIITILFILSVHLLSAQPYCSQYCLNFEDTACSNHLIIDTVTFPNNIWQTGKPQKTMFNTAYSAPNVIITDTVNPYPVNNHSVFIIRNFASVYDIYGFIIFTGAYNVQTDSLNDSALIEFSPNNGKLWVNMITDTFYKAFTWYSQKPVLTGNSHGWKFFEVSLNDIGSVFNIQLGDTLLYRFTFISDGVADNLAGLMFDDFCFSGFVEGISKIKYQPMSSKIYPNPSASAFAIEFDNPAGELFELSVYDICSKLMLKKENIVENKIQFDAAQFKPGIYVYKLTNLKAHKRSWGKFILSE